MKIKITIVQISPWILHFVGHLKREYESSFNSCENSSENYFWSLFIKLFCNMPENRALYFFSMEHLFFYYFFVCIPLVTPYISLSDGSRAITNRIVIKVSSHSLEGGCAKACSLSKIDSLSLTSVSSAVSRRCSTPLLLHKNADTVNVDTANG